MVGGIIPLRRATSSRYDGRLEQESALKALEDENRRLKKLLAESMLDASTLKEMLGKNFCRPACGNEL
jgi:putative transposase